MIRNTKLTGVLLTLFALSLAGCGQESDKPSTGKGGITPNVELNTTVKSSKQSRADGDITVNDLSLTIKSKDGTFSKTWATIGDYSEDEKFDIGQYTVEAAYGSIENEGFEKPAYFGSTDVTVTENNITPVSVTASLANTMVSIEYTDAFKNYMQTWSSQVHATGGDYITFTRNETRPAYLRPGEVTLNVIFTKPGATQEVNLQVAKFEALARHHYHITLDLNNGGAGDAVLTVVLDEMLTQENVEIELSDELLNAPAPTITSLGVTNDEVINHVAGTPLDKQVKFNIIARGGLSAVTLTTQSEDLVKQKGFPAEINLLSVDDANVARLKQFGLKGTGLWKNPEKMAVVDMNDLILGLAENATSNVSKFSLSVTDKLGKSSEVFSFTIDLEPQDLELSNPSLMMGQGELSADLKFNGGDPKNVTIEYLNDRGTWTTTTATVGVRSRASQTYSIKVPVPADNKDLSVRARTSIKTSNVLVVTRQAPDYTASVTDDNTWAKKAYVTLSSSQVSAESLAAIATAFVSTDGSTFAKATTKNAGNGVIEISGLNPATAYTVKVSVSGSADQACEPITFTTEAATNLPNAGFETLSESLKETELNQGGKWSISAGINYQSTLTYTISEPTSWASVNKKTTSSSTRNSWFVVPSTFNSTLTWESTVPKIHVIGTGGGTETPESYSGFTAHGGSNAMVIRNVAWDPAGTVPGVWKKEFADKEEYYNHTEPEISKVSAGKLFLGSYTYTSGTETYNEGYNFTSRPSGLSFYYMYTPDTNDANEKGMVNVQVLNGTKVIATGSATLSSSLTYTLANVALTYIANAPKATSIRVMFASSNHTDETQIKVSTYNYRYESAKHGATLVVDDLSLSY